MLKETYSATAIANYFIGKGVEEDSPTTQLRLLSIIYFSQQMANSDKILLLDEDPKFVGKGPIPSYNSLSNALTPKGNDKITSRLKVRASLEELTYGTKFDRLKNNVGLKISPEIPENDNLAKEYLDIMWRLFNPLSGPQMAHICMNGGQYGSLIFPLEIRW
jgi:uncharacterized phage-associated protein